MDIGRQRDLLPHYLAILVAVVVVLGWTRLAVGDVGAPVNLGLTVVVVLAYPPIVRVLGFAPQHWER